jgi:hypothetical protein
VADVLNFCGLTYGLYCDNGNGHFVKLKHVRFVLLQRKRSFRSYYKNIQFEYCQKI